MSTTEFTILLRWCYKTVVGGIRLSKLCCHVIERWDKNSRVPWSLSPSSVNNVIIEKLITLTPFWLLKSVLRHWTAMLIYMHVNKEVQFEFNAKANVVVAACRQVNYRTASDNRGKLKKHIHFSLKDDATVFCFLVDSLLFEVRHTSYTIRRSQSTLHVRSSMNPASSVRRSWLDDVPIRLTASYFPSFLFLHFPSF